MKFVFRLLVLVFLCLACTAAAPAASNYVVRARGIGSVWVFQPTNITISVGDTITWTNSHGTAHDSTAGIPNSGTNNGWASPLLTTGTGETFPFTFTSAGYYPYRCRTHADTNPPPMSPHPEQTGSVMVVGMNFAPIISLTNPPAGGAAVAPAALNLQAAASDPDGSVTNVQFLANGAPLGSVTGAPFALLTAPLGAGNYTFTAVATDNAGLSATSAPVPFFLLTNAVLTNLALSNGAAQLTVLGIAGQTYVFDATANLSNWTPFATSIAPAAVFQVQDSNAAAFPNRNYRARQTVP